MVVAADSVWSALPARIDLLAAELQRTRSLAHSVGRAPRRAPGGRRTGARSPHELTDAARARWSSDPLAFWLPRGGSSAPGGGRPDTAALRPRGARPGGHPPRDRGGAARPPGRRAAARCGCATCSPAPTAPSPRRAAARGEVLAKIAASEVPAVSGPPTALHEQLAHGRRVPQARPVAPALAAAGVAWSSSAEDELLRARESLTAVTAPLAVRAELRGRLDAYKAKVARHGMAEDPLLIERYDAARRHAVERALRPARRRAGGAALPAGGRRGAGARGVPASGGPDDRRGPRRVSDSGERQRMPRQRAASAASGPAATGRYEDMGGGELYCDTCGLAPVVVAARAWSASPPDRLTGGRPAARAAVGAAAVAGAVGSRGPSARVRRPGPSQLPPLGLRAAVALAVRAGVAGRSVSVRSSGSAAGRLRPRPARRGPGRGAGGAAARPARGGAGRPRGARAEAVLQPRRLRGAGGPRPRRAGRAAPRASAPSAATRTRSCRSCARATSCTASTRWWAAWRTAGSAGSTSPWTARSSDRWVVLKGLLDTGDQDAHGRGDLRAALPRRDRARQHRADLQLRRAPRPAHRHPRRLHRHGVRRRQVAQGDRQRPPHPGRQARPAAGRAGRARTASRRWRRSAICTAATCCTATSRSTTRSRPRTSSS